MAADFAAPRWVRRRCAHAEARIRAGLDAARATAPWPDRVLRWLFATGVSTHVLLTAALGCAHLTPERVREHIGALTVIFDETSQVVEAAASEAVPLAFYASGLSRAARTS